MDFEMIDLLFENADEWNRYINKKGHDTVNDFSFQIIKEKQLGNRVFPNFDFTGTQFEFVNFDGSRFEKCNFENVSFLYVSFVGCEFFECTFSNDIIEYITFRNTKVLQCMVERMQTREMNVSACKLENCLVTDSCLKKTTVFGLEVYNTEINRSIIRDISINICTFQDVNITRYVLHTIQMNKTAFIDCGFIKGVIWFETTSKTIFCESIFQDLKVNKHILKECEITKSQMRKLDLKEWGLAETIYVGTHFDDCNWPDMSYRLSMFGVLKTSIYLPLTPVQDISGVDPMLRRTVRDSQYLSYIDKKCNNIIKKILFCFWGATSGYGQSISRLLITLFGGTVIIAIVGIIRDNFGGKTFNRDEIFQYIFSVFLKVIDIDLVYNITLNQWVVFMAQLFGLIWFGLLIGVATTKLTQLGAD